MNPVISVIAPKRPMEKGWSRMPDVEAVIRAQDQLMRAYAFEFWLHSETGLQAMSAVEHPTPLPGEMDLGAEYHLSVSKAGARCASFEAMWVLAQFGLPDAKEDNHVPSGRARNFWRPVADHLSGYECPCQDSEPAIREDKGDYVWRGVPSA